MADSHFFGGSIDRVSSIVVVIILKIFPVSILIETIIVVVVTAINEDISSTMLALVELRSQ